MYHFGYNLYFKTENVLCLISFTVLKNYMKRSHKYLFIYLFIYSFCLFIYLFIFVSLDQLIICIN